MRAPRLVIGALGLGLLLLAMVAPGGPAGSGADEQRVVFRQAPVPGLTVHDATTNEADGGVSITISRTGNLDTSSSVRVSTSPGTATSADFTPLSGVLVTWLQGEVDKTVPIAITDDALDENQESFDVLLHDPVSADFIKGSAFVLIADDDPEPTVSMDPIGTVPESAGLVLVRVRINPISGRDVNTHIETQNGSAIAGDDFLSFSSPVQLSAEQTEYQVGLNIVDDDVVEPTETMTMHVTVPGAGGVVVGGSQVVTITDDEPSVPGTTTTTWFGNRRRRRDDDATTTTIAGDTTRTTVADGGTDGPDGERRVGDESDGGTDGGGDRGSDGGDDGGGADRGSDGGSDRGSDGGSRGSDRGGDGGGDGGDGGSDGADGGEDGSGSEGGGSGGGRGQARRSDLVASVVQPKDVELSLPRIASSAAAAFALLGLIAYSSELFDSTFESNETRIRRAFRWLPKRREDTTRRRRGFQLTACVLAGGAVFTALSDHLALDATTLTLYIGMTAAVALTSFGLVLADVRFVRKRQPTDGHMQALPLGLAIGIAGVALSKAVGFHPGYAYGVLAGWAFATPLNKRDEGHVAALTTANLLGVALLAWLVRVPVTEQALRPDPRPVWLALEATLTGVFMLCLDSGIVGLIPVRFLRGRSIYRWSRPVWVLLSFIGLTLFVLLLLQPGGGQIVEHDTFRTNIAVLCLLFTGGSVAFWAWFHFVPDPADASAGATVDD